MIAVSVGAMQVILCVLAGCLIIGVAWEVLMKRTDDDAKRYDETLAGHRLRNELRRREDRSDR